ncbi:MAG: hypothetical protein ACRDNM_04665 [Gaiellaceae bacterium]
MFGKQPLFTLAAGIAAAGSIAVAGARTAASPAPAGGGFGGGAAVHISRVGRIETDLESPVATGLRRIRCAGPASNGARCYVAR